MDNGGFFAGLFDFSFTQFVTARLIRVIYILAVIASGIGSAAVFIGCLASRSFAGVLLGFILAPVVFFVWILIARIWLELVIVVFRIAENTSALVALGKQAPPSQT